MWCLISQANAVVIEVNVEAKSKGQEVLEKACEVLGIRPEADYFGLRYISVKGQEVWLNLRNPVERQVGGQPPFRFALRVKFWVPPHYVLQDSTREVMYLEVKAEMMEGRLQSERTEGRLKAGALLCQAELGPWEPGAPPSSLHVQVSSALRLPCPRALAAEQTALERMTKPQAHYWLLKEVATLESFGEEIFSGRGTKLGIGPHGLSVYHPEDTVDKIPYSAIRSASSMRRLFQLWYLGPDHTETLLELKCDSGQAASGLYRALTEKHAFYSCDTVRGAVTAQYIRDLKGTIVSIFNESSGFGKKFVFDIQRTCREVHDNARRALYEGSTSSGAEGSSSTSSEAAAHDKLARFIDALTCRICMDAGIDTVLFPCAHVICCHACAERCTACPLCRSSIESAKRVYLPTLELGLPQPAHE